LTALTEASELCEVWAIGLLSVHPEDQLFLLKFPGLVEIRRDRLRVGYMARFAQINQSGSKGKKAVALGALNFSFHDRLCIIVKSAVRVYDVVGSSLRNK
jgi:hypothetical protein